MPVATEVALGAAIAGRNTLVGRSRAVAAGIDVQEVDAGHARAPGWAHDLRGDATDGLFVHLGKVESGSFKVAENPVHVHDLHATILHLLGFDHEKFTYRYAGRDFRLTDVHGHVVKELLA